MKILKINLRCGPFESIQVTFVLGYNSFMAEKYFLKKHL